MTGRVYPTVREAINATAPRAAVPLKVIAVEVDWFSPPTTRIW